MIESLHLQTLRVGRRRLLITGVAVPLAVLLGGCTRAPEAQEDWAPRFAKFAPSDEPDADPNKAVWPEFILQAGPDVRRLYEFQLQNGALMRYMPCFCGCGDDGHRNNRDCYLKQVNPDGSVVFDAMAPT